MNNAINIAEYKEDEGARRLRQMTATRTPKEYENGEISTIVFDESKDLPTTEVTIVKNVFFVRHRGALIQISADQVPCLTYDAEENRVNIICDKSAPCKSIMSALRADARKKIECYGKNRLLMTSTPESKRVKK